jgi:hypothetical protein
MFVGLLFKILRILSEFNLLYLNIELKICSLGNFFLNITIDAYKLFFTTFFKYVKIFLVSGPFYTFISAFDRIVKNY